jgi:sugar O-acyltransferase (sialic acid O-acetyltransferase NeuD family)
MQTQAMNEALVIWGAGGHGTVVLDIARDSGNYKHIVFFDDDSSKMNSIVCECAVIGDRGQFDRFAGSAFVIAIGHNQMRARCFDLAVASGLTPVALLHRTSVISSMARIGRGTVVMPGAIINSGARVGDNCIINSGAIVEHDCEIGSPFTKSCPWRGSTGRNVSTPRIRGGCSSRCLDWRRINSRCRRCRP